ncbi:MAG: NAD(P)/FAD-dependent oxidoreductase [Planctomycetes bacterium]|nr:NAD(P)/FAD-dependent oxidoreductase [Planctomycetota bacterium]
MMEQNTKPRVVVVGAGFGGLEAARRLGGADLDVVVIDRRNHHLFQPLLYQVATAALSPADIAAPIRKILRRFRGVRVLLGEVTGIDTVGRKITVDGSELSFDWLVLAVGATHSYFGRPEWERFAPGLKTVEDALEIRRRFLLAFERAEGAKDESERRAAMTFAVVGAGPTGVELAGAMAEIARTVLPGDFRIADPRAARVVLIEGEARVLSAMPEECSVAARRQLEELGVEVVCGSRVTHIDEFGVTAGDLRIEARTVLWAAGVQASPLCALLGRALDRAGRVMVRPDLSIDGDERVFVIGDAAHCIDVRTGAQVPGMAPGALQMGRFVARTIVDETRAAARGFPAPTRSAFVYRDKGALATVGRSRAVADVGGRRFSGFAAWILWALVHVTAIVRFRNRMFVLMGWIWSYLFFDRGARLITGSTKPR